MIYLEIFNFDVILLKFDKCYIYVDDEVCYIVVGICIFGFVCFDDS